MDNKDNRDNVEMKASTAAKRELKKTRREAKALRKEANKIEEKKGRPNNLVLAAMIFGILILMFVFVKGYNYFSKDASIQEYLENNGGEDVYGSMMIDAYTTAAITAEGNSMKIVLDSTAEGEDEETLREFYGSDDGKEQLDYLAAYFLTSIKPETRGFSADAEVISNVNGEEVNKTTMTYKEAKKFMKDELSDTDDASDEEESDAEDGDADEGSNSESETDGE